MNHLSDPAWWVRYELSAERISLATHLHPLVENRSLQSGKRDQGHLRLLKSSALELIYFYDRGDVLRDQGYQRVREAKVWDALTSKTTVNQPASSTAEK